MRGGNSYLIDGDNLTLVDAGWPGNGRKILEYIRALGRQPEELKYILLTHAHPDHGGAGPELRKATGARLLAHAGDTRMGRKGHRFLTFPGHIFFRRVQVDGLLDDGDCLPVLGGLEVLHTPGHTPGSVCFYGAERGVLFTGDTLLSDGRDLERSILFSSLSQYYRSMARLAELTYEVACVGHGRPCVDGASARVKRLSELYWRTSPLWWRLVKHIPRTTRLGLRVLAG